MVAHGDMTKATRGSGQRLSCNGTDRPVASHGHRGSIDRVVVAADNPVFQGVLRVIPANRDYLVEGACDGKEAWQILRAKGAPGLAILDWMMPGLDGIEVCRLARAEFGRRDRKS